MTRIVTFFGLLVAGALATVSTAATAQDYAVPERVARLSMVQGDVSISPATGDTWLTARLNRPLLRGDRLYTGSNSRAVVQMAGAELRVDGDSAVDLMALDENRVQIRLTQGTANLAVHRIDANDTYEIDTPALAFVAERPGSYRIDIDPDGYGAIVTVFSGAGSVWDAQNRRQSVARGTSYRFDSADVGRVRAVAIPRHNDFDRFCAELDSRYVGSDSSRYVANNVIGYADLDRYGSWRSSPEYGHVWYPSNVAAGWAPYRNGRWAWIEPWGWTWIDAAPWGFAPFHYGRWAYVGNRWGWVPGPHLRRAVFAPALVAFVGNVSISIGGAAPVGWFPLGPRDIYRPPYRVSENYFININLGGGRFFQRTGMRRHWHDYRDQRGHDFRYAYRHDTRAVTVVSRTQFRDSRLVTRSSARMSEAVLRQSHVERAPQITPGNRAALTARAGARPERDVFARPVVSRTPLANNGTAATLRGAPRGAPRAASTSSTLPGTRNDAAVRAPNTVLRQPARSLNAPREPDATPSAPRAIAPRTYPSRAPQTPTRSPQPAPARPLITPRGEPAPRLDRRAPTVVRPSTPTPQSTPAPERDSAPLRHVDPTPARPQITPRGTPTPRLDRRAPTPIQPRASAPPRTLSPRRDVTPTRQTVTRQDTRVAPRARPSAPAPAAAAAPPRRSESKAKAAPTRSQPSLPVQRSQPADRAASPRGAPRRRADGNN